MRSPRRLAAPARALAALLAAASLASARAAVAAAPRGGDVGTRALERTLVSRGGLVLPAGEYELVPALSYAFDDAEPILLGDATVGEAETRRFVGAVTLRLGLPFRLQAEGRVPFVYAQQTGGDPEGRVRTSTGVGDVRAGLTWHVLRAGARAPDVLVSGFWNGRTGRSRLDGDPVRVPLGTGFESFGGGITLVKAFDPLVVLAAVQAEEGVPRRVAAGWLDPRAALGIVTTAILPLSPETSLSFGLEQRYAQAARVAGTPIPETEVAAAIFNVGFATLASGAGMIEASVGVGLTQDSPRFQVSLGTPLQF